MSKSRPCAHVLGMGVQRNTCVSHNDKPKLKTEPGGHLGRAGPAGPRANVAESFAQREGGRCPGASPTPRLLWEQRLSPKYMVSAPLTSAVESVAKVTSDFPQNPFCRLGPDSQRTGADSLSFMKPWTLRFPCLIETKLPRMQGLLLPARAPAAT